MGEKQTQELAIVRELLDAFNKHIRYCHWKSNQHFKDALIGVDDLDILIDRSQYNDVLSILSKLNFKHFYTPAPRTYVGIEDYLGFDEDTGKIIHLHLHSRLVVGEKHLKGFLLPIENRVLSNRYFNEEYQAYHSSYFDELLLLILRSGMKLRKRDFFKKRIIGHSTQAEFDWLKAKDKSFIQELTDVDFLTDNTKKNVQAIFDSGFKFKLLNRLKHDLYKNYSFLTQGSGFYNTRKRTSREIGRIFLEIKKKSTANSKTFTRRRSATGGSIIAFIGSDGAGKSTTIKEIYKWLSKNMDVRLFYLGSGDGTSSLLRKPLIFLMKFGQKTKLIKKNNTTSIKPEKLDGYGRLSLPKKLWIYTLSRERIKKLKKVSICRNFGYIVLTDRYPQSELPGLCDGKRAGGKGFAGRKEEAAFRIAKICPPDVAIKMIVDPAIAAQRKPDEINLESSKQLTEKIKKIKFSDHTKSFYIDSSEPLENVLLSVKKAIWNNL